MLKKLVSLVALGVGCLTVMFMWACLIVIMASGSMAY